LAAVTRPAELTEARSRLAAAMGARPQRPAGARGFRPAGSPFAAAANLRLGSLVASHHSPLLGGAGTFPDRLRLACGLSPFMIAEKLDSNYIFRKEKHALRLVDLLYEALMFI
jgi:hypothetical protein